MRARQLVSILLVLLTASSTQADDTKFTTVGGEFQVNTYTTSLQEEPRVAIGPAGDFMVVWSSVGSSGTDTSYESIQAQRYASDGTEVGGELQLNTYTTGRQEEPVVSITSNGDFVVFWESSEVVGGSDPPVTLQGQRFASDATPVGSLFQINTYTTSGIRSHDVVMNDDGDFVVVWTSLGSGGTDTSGRSVQGRRYASDGALLGSQFQVNTYTTAGQTSPSVALDDEGDFVVVWQSLVSSGMGADVSVRGQRYASDGSARGGEFQVNSDTLASYAFQPSVASSASGDFVVVWAGDGTGLDPFGIQGQRYASDGSALGSQFQINSYTSSYQVFPAATMDDAGNFSVVWTSGGTFGGDGPDGSEGTVVGQRFASDGTPLDGEVVINTYTTASQEFPDIAVGADGDFVVVWTSEGSSGTDTSSDSVQAQRLTLEADLAITKTDGVTSVDPGGTVTYTLVASNAGPNAASGVTVTDIFPFGLTCSWMSVASGGATGHTDASGDLMDTLIMPAGSMVTYTVTCDVSLTAVGTLSNTATISSPFDDPNTSNNSATDDDTALTEQANLSVVKTGTGVAEPLSELIYTLAVANAGTLEATSVTLTDTLPAGTTFVSASGAGFTCGEAGGVVTCTRAALASGASVQVRITVLAPAAEGTISNTASVSAAQPDFDTTNDSSTFETAIVAALFEDGYESGNTSAWSNTVD